MTFFKIFGHTWVSIRLKLWGSIVTEVSYGEFNLSIILEPLLSPFLSGAGSCLCRKFLSYIKEIWAFWVRCLFCNFSDKQCCLPSTPNALLQYDAKTTEVLRIQDYLEIKEQCKLLQRSVSPDILIWVLTTLMCCQATLEATGKYQIILFFVYVY